MKKYVSVLLSVILTFSCLGILASCSLFEKERILESALGFEEYESGTVLFDAAGDIANDKVLAYSPKGKAFKGEDFVAANVTVTNSNAYTGEKSMEYKVYNQTVTAPMTLLPNTKYTLSFFFYCKTEEADCFISRIDCGIYDLKKSEEAGSMTKLSGTGTSYKEVFTSSFAPNTWRKIVVNFETKEEVENAAFGVKFTAKSKESGKTVCLVDDINLSLAENTPKSEVTIENTKISSVELITATPNTIFPNDKIEFKVVTANGLTPEVKVNSETLTPNENGIYSFVAKSKVKIKVECEGDDDRLNVNEDKNGNDLTKYNYDVAAIPVWQGNTVYHETALFVPGRETAKLLYPISEAISVRSYDLYTSYVEGLDYEITSDGLIKRLENSRIPVYEGALTTETENAFPTADGKYLEFIGDYTYVKYAIAVTYEHKAEWQGEEGYNPIKIESVQDKIPNIFKKLENGEEVNIVIYGDSISTGWSSSGLNYVDSIYSKTGVVGSCVLNVPPYTPPFPEMLKEGLEKLYPDATVNVKILALGGTKSNWGASAIRGRLDYLGEGYKADLMILAYGGNDATAKMSSDDFYSNMQNIIHGFNDYNLEVDNTDAEVLLWSQSLPNTAATTYVPEVFLGYQDELEYIADDNEGVALVKLTDQFVEVLKSKEAIDYLNTNVNHPNDFTTRIIAQGLISALTPKDK